MKIIEDEMIQATRFACRYCDFATEWCECGPKWGDNKLKILKHIIETHKDEVKPTEDDPWCRGYQVEKRNRKGKIMNVKAFYSNLEDDENKRK